MKKSRSIILMAILLAFAALGIQTVAAQSAQIGGFVFSDNNVDGFPDGAGRTLGGAEIALVRKADSKEEVLATQKTGEDGLFLFTDLAAGDYYLRIMLPRDYVPTRMVENGSFALPASGASTATPIFSLDENQSMTDIQLGAAKKTGFVRVIAFGDENANAGRFSTEPLLRDVLVELIYERAGKQYVIGSTRTDREGLGTIRDVTPGTYRLAVTLPDPYIIGPLGPKISLFYNGIVPADSPRGFSEPFDLPAGGSLGIGAGGVLTSQVAGQVWADLNQDGSRDVNETGFSGAELLLKNPDSGVERSFTTQPDGAFIFERLPAGDYTLTVTLPDDAMFTVPGESLLSDGFTQTDTVRFSVNLGRSTTLDPIGVMPLTSLSVHFFHDENVDGLYEEAEAPFAGAQVEIIRKGSVLAASQTDSNGYALFSPVRGGEFQVRAVLPDDQIFTVAHEDGSAFSASRASNDLTLEYYLEHGNHADILAGVTLPAAISGIVFDDADLSGIHEATETFLSDFRAAAIDEAGRVVSESVTDEAGRYLLEDLIPGEYAVRFSLLSPFIFSDASGTGAVTENKVVTQTPLFGETAPVNVRPGETLAGVDAGAFRSGIINGQVLLGDDSDDFLGQRGGLPGVQIALLFEDGSEVSEYTIAQTDAEGTFSLKGALPGTYMLRYALPNDAAFSQPLLDDPVWQSPVFAVKSSDIIQAEPVFTVKTGTITGTVFVDKNADGLYGGDDTPFEGAEIMMKSAVGEPATSVSNAEGLYQFSMLRPGNYTVIATLPQNALVGHSVSSPVPAALNNASSADMEITMGLNSEQRDIAVSSPANLSFDLFYDNNLNSTRDAEDTAYPFAEMTLTHHLTGMEFLVNTDETGQASLDSVLYGNYSYAFALPEDHIVFAPKEAVAAGTAWEGSVSALDFNTEVQIALVQYGVIEGAIWNLDGGNDNIAGIALTLRRASDGELVATATTDANGTYRFTGLFPGQYTVGTRLPDGFRFARQVDKDIRYSVITAESVSVAAEQGQSELIVLQMGEYKAKQDIGMGAMGKLGDLAWLDLDGDGMQDAGEPGIPGISIRLYQYGVLVAETISNEYGRYMFEELYPGHYSIEVTMPPELRTTIRQTEFPLVASILPQSDDTRVQVDGVIVPSKSRNLNGDLGFVLRTPDRYPASMQNITTKDWTPLVPYTPTR